MSFNWRKLDEGRLKSGVTWDGFLGKVRALRPYIHVWRHNAAGDLPGSDNRLDRDQCLALADANASGGRNRGGFTFTHYPVIKTEGISPDTLAHNREVIREMNDRGFAVNLSADTVAQADQMVALDIAPVVVLLPMDTASGFRTPHGNPVTVCPAALSNHGTTCMDCRICQRVDRGILVGFPAHGNCKKKADRISKG